MFDFVDLMIDTETMGLGSNGALCSIGAVFFDVRNSTLGPTFNATIHLATAMRDGGTIDAGTVMWWLGQEDAARKAIRFGGRDIKDVLTEFGTFIAETCRHEDVRPWGNSASFDLTKIDTACQRSGVKTPWYWTNERDFRTVRNLHPKVEYDPSLKGVSAHNALADAVFQAEHLFAIQRSLRNSSLVEKS